MMLTMKVKKLKKLESKKITIIDSGNNKGYSYALNVGCKYLIDKYKVLNIKSVPSRTKMSINKRPQ